MIKFKSLLLEEENQEPSISYDQIKVLAQKYGLMKYITEQDPSELIEGYKVESEHKRNDALNVVQNDGDILKILLVHLLETKNYYSTLKKVHL